MAHDKEEGGPIQGNGIAAVNGAEIAYDVAGSGPAGSYFMLGSATAGCGTPRFPPSPSTSR